MALTTYPISFGVGTRALNTTASILKLRNYVWTDSGSLVNLSNVTNTGSSVTLAFDYDEDVALNAYGHVTSQNYGYNTSDPNKVVDGNPTTFYYGGDQSMERGDDPRIPGYSTITLDLQSAYTISRFYMYGGVPVNAVLQYSTDGLTYTTLGTIRTNSAIFMDEYTLDFALTTARYWKIYYYGIDTMMYISTISLYGDYYNTGSFETYVYDLRNTPTEIPYINANITTPVGTSVTIYSSTSTDGVTWSTWTVQNNNSELSSTLARYLKLKFVLATSDTSVTPTVGDIVIGGIFRSEIFTLENAIAEWGNISGTETLNNQTISYWVRGANTFTDVNSATWVEQTLNTLVSGIGSRKYIQLEIRLNSNTYAQTPEVTNVSLSYNIGLNLGVKTQSPIASVSLLCTDNLAGTPLHIRKGSTNYGLVLVDKTDIIASPLRVMTSSGIKAVAKVV